MKYLLYILSVFTLAMSFAQTPGAKQNKSILIKNGTAHLGNGKTINKAYIGLDNGMFTLVKDMLTNTIDESKFDTIIDASGKQIYPGFINLNNTLGITEIDAVRSTRDFREVGLFKPHVRSQIAFNTESIVVSTVRTNGVLITQPTPRSGLISGTSSIMNLDGWNWEDATLKQDDGIHLNWSWMDENPEAKSKHLKRYDEQLKKLYTYFDKAKSYFDKGEIDQSNLEFNALNGVFNGDKRLYIHADLAKQIIDIFAFVKKYKIKHPVIVGGTESYLVSDELKSLKIPVIIGRIHSLPMNEDDPVDESFTLAKKLQDAGVLFGMQGRGDMEAMNSRNLPFNAGTARTYGLTNEQAIEAITLSNAKICGIDNEVGSIEKGKQATFFISSGDALDQITNKVELAFIQGRKLDLNNHQKNLYKKYSKKLGIEIKD